MTARPCARAGCMNTVPDKTPGRPGVQAKWCSDQCRKHACDDRHRANCIACGHPLHARSGWAKTHGSNERCRPCWVKMENAAHRARVEDAAEMYREGLSYREIATSLGYSANSTPPEVNEAFALGLLSDADRRYSKQRTQNTAQARWGEAA